MYEMNVCAGQNIGTSIRRHAGYMNDGISSVKFATCQQGKRLVSYKNISRKPQHILVSTQFRLRRFRYRYRLKPFNILHIMWLYSYCYLFLKVNRFSCSGNSVECKFKHVFQHFHQKIYIGIEFLLYFFSIISL